MSPTRKVVLVSFTLLLLAVPAVTHAQTAEPVRHRFESAVRVGVLTPGEMSPVNWFHTDTSTAPFFGAGGEVLLGSFFSIGPYVHFAPFSFKRRSGSDTIGTGSGLYLSVGAAAKLRLSLSDSLRLGAGVTVGWNYVNYDGTTSRTKEVFTLLGTGLQVGPIVDGAFNLTQSLAVSARMGFLTQPAGNAAVTGFPTEVTAEGEVRSFAFAPIFYFTVGPEFRF